jgi:hypothetical protein
MSIAVLTTNGWYRAVLVAHIFCAIVGFGTVYLNAIYGAEVRKRRGLEGLAVYEANFRVSMIGQYFIYAVFVLGLALVGLGDPWKFSQTWIWLATVFYVLGLGISHGVLQPAVKRMGVLMREMIAATASGPSSGPPPQATEMASLGQRVGAAGATLNVIVIVILVLMVWKPGA